LHPFFWSLPEGVLEQFDFLVHCHTKKSLHLSRRFWETKSLGQKWLEDLVRQTLGAPDSVPVMDAIFEKMESDTSIGLSFPQRNFMSGWDENFRFARELAPDLAQADDGGVFEFPQGSFFVARTEVLKPIRKLALPIELIPKEPIPPDGTVLHAIERMIGKASESVGYRTLLVSFPRGRLWYSKCLVKTRHSSFT
jgi:lipopolysaccharide biosynthesis protein